MEAPSFTAILTAILETTTDATPMDFEVGIGWHSADTNLMLKNSNPEVGHVVEPLLALGYMAPNDTLQRARTYIIMGPFGQDPITGEFMIRHNAQTQTEVASHPPENLDNLAGKATLSGLGLVLDARFRDHSRGWDMTVEAEHKWYDPIHEVVLEFAVTYQFGFLTPEPANWAGIKAGARMWFHGTVVRKDPVSQRLIVKVRDYSLARAAKCECIPKPY